MASSWPRSDPDPVALELTRIYRAAKVGSRTMASLPLDVALFSGKVGPDADQLGAMVETLAAAEELAADGIDAE
jgi:hypothetical protein